MPERISLCRKLFYIKFCLKKWVYTHPPTNCWYIMHIINYYGPFYMNKPSIGQSTKALHSSILNFANLVQQILNRYKLGQKDQRNLFDRNEELEKSRKWLFCLLGAFCRSEWDSLPNQDNWQEAGASEEIFCSLSELSWVKVIYHLSQKWSLQGQVAPAQATALV